MVNTYKQMHFFKLRMYSFIKDGKNADVQHFLSIDEKNKIMSDLIDTKLNENNSINVEYNPEKLDDSRSAVVEIINSTDQYIFGKIGKKKDINAFQLRNISSMKSEPIPKDKDQIFEIFSYFFIDKESFCVGYLHESSAPSINYLGILISNEYKHSQHVFGQVDMLLIEDALPILSKKDIIGSISYKVVLPFQNMPAELTGLPQKDFENLQNQKEVVINIDLKAKKRNESVFSTKEKLTSFFNSLTSKAQGLSKVEVNAKDFDEKISQTFTLNNNPFVKKVKFAYDSSLDTYADIQENIEQQMKTTFNSNREGIQDYLK